MPNRCSGGYISASAPPVLRRGQLVPLLRRTKTRGGLRGSTPFLLPEQSGEHSRQSPLTHEPRHPHCLVLMRELVAALCANDPDAFRGLLSEDMQEPGVIDVDELLAGLVLGGESLNLSRYTAQESILKNFLNMRSIFALGRLWYTWLLL